MKPSHGFIYWLDLKLGFTAASQYGSGRSQCKAGLAQTGEPARLCGFANAGGGKLGSHSCQGRGGPVVLLRVAIHIRLIVIVRICSV